MATSNPLLLSTKKDEEAADTLLAALSTIAHAQPTKPVKSKKQHRSRFFYKPTQSFHEDVEERKKISLPKEVEIVDRQVVERLNTYKTELPPALNENIDHIREFWLNNIAPLTLAAQSGSLQAKDVVQRLLEVPIDETPFAQFEHMMKNATTIKMARYIAEYMGLPKSYANALVDGISPKKEMIFPHPYMLDDRRSRDSNPNNPQQNPNNKPKAAEVDLEANLRQ